MSTSAGDDGGIWMKSKIYIKILISSGVFRNLSRGERGLHFFLFTGALAPVGDPRTPLEIMDIPHRPPPWIRLCLYPNPGVILSPQRQHMTKSKSYFFDFYFCQDDSWVTHPCEIIFASLKKGVLEFFN